MCPMPREKECQREVKYFIDNKNLTVIKSGACIGHIINWIGAKRNEDCEFMRLRSLSGG